jgi:N-acylneuraminate cytidylyltransferase
MILGLIPARGGSKGVPGKNIKEIYGKPLIVWTIERAIESKRLDKVLVSTDSEEIAKIAMEAGAEVQMRPEKLATDDASTLDVMKYVLSLIPAETMVLLQPTSPYREKGRIDECIECFFESNSDSLATGYMCDKKEYGTNSLPRQKIKGFFYDDGSIYVIKSENIMNGDRYGEKIYPMYTTRYENAEIDDEYDFWILEKTLEKMDKEGKL